MSTFLFNSIINGPLKSRRLGISLGVNLMPAEGKLCNFNCIYCECGWTLKGDLKLRYNPRRAVYDALESRLKEITEKGEQIDVITFAGNGEPTTHPDFPEIIDDTITLRNRYVPSAKIAVLSNATMLGRENVRHALERIDRAILKIDSALIDTIKIINDPKFNYSLLEVVDQMKRFKGEVIVQTMLLRGEVNGVYVDNTSDEEVAAYIDIIKQIRPSLVMLYSIDRDTPAPNLHKISKEEMQPIADAIRALDITCTVA